MARPEVRPARGPPATKWFSAGGLDKSKPEIELFDDLPVAKHFPFQQVRQSSFNCNIGGKTLCAERVTTG
jgi:hypothetical protein